MYKSWKCLQKILKTVTTSVNPIYKEYSSPNPSTTMKTTNSQVLQCTLFSSYSSTANSSTSVVGLNTQRLASLTGIFHAWHTFWWRCAGSLVEMWWLIGGYVMAHWWRCGGKIAGDVVAYCWRCEGLLMEMWWTIGGDGVVYWWICVG